MTPKYPAKASHTAALSSCHSSLMAFQDGYRESAESWVESLLRDLKRRGMGAPVLAVGGWALGFRRW